MSKIAIKLNIGGVLQTGDVVGIAGNNYTTFGWFVESGASGSLKYLHFGVVNYYIDDYTNYLTDTNPPNWKIKKYSNGLTFKTISKDYILKFNAKDNRAFKISNPQEFFKDSDLEAIYLKGRQVLNDIKFPAK